MTKPTSDQIRAVAYLTHAIRPDWQRAGIEAVLHGLGDTTDLAAMTHAAIVAAKTRTDQTTPAVIGLIGPHWGTCTGDKPHAHLPVWRDDLADAKRADPATVAKYANQARQAAREATTLERPTQEKP